MLTCVSWFSETSVQFVTTPATRCLPSKSVRTMRSSTAVAFIITTLGELRAQVREAKLTRTALIFVGRVFGEARFRESRLYAADFAHVLRNAGKKRTRQAAG